MPDLDPDLHALAVRWLRDKGCAEETIRWLVEYPTNYVDWFYWREALAAAAFARTIRDEALAEERKRG
jgi:hypothetical protein